MRIKIVRGEIMKKIITKAVCIKNIITWTVISLLCVLVLIVFVKKLIEGLTNNTELFIPGISLLFAVAILFLIFGITRIIKYIRLIK